MRHLRLPAGAILFVVTCLTGLSAGAESYQFSNSIYTLPPGWQLMRAERDFQTLGPEDDDGCGFCYLYIGRSLPAVGSLKSFVSKNKRVFFDPDDDTAITELQPINEFQDYGYSIAMQTFKADGAAMFLLGFHVNDRYEIIGFQGNADDEEGLAKTLATFKTIVPAYMNAVRFVSNGAPPLMPAPQPGPYDGAWFGTYLNQSVGMDMMMRMDLASSLYVFWPNGYFHDGTPPFGMAAPDPAYLREPTVTEYGVYRVQGDQVRLTYANGETDSLTIEGEGLSDGRASMFMVKPLPDASMIEGTISSSYASGFGGVGMMSQGGVSTSSYTTFYKDGTFGGESSSTSFGSFGDGMGGTTGGYSAGSQDGHSGRYQIRNGLIFRQGPDGSEATEPDLIFDMDGAIYIGQQALEKE